MAVVKQLSIQVENKRGTLAAICSELAKVAVNIGGISVRDYPGKYLIRIVPNPLETAKKVLKQMGHACKEDTVITVHLADRPGSLGKITRKLSDKGIDILYVYGTIERRSDRAMIVMGVSDPEKASQIVK